MGVRVMYACVHTRTVCTDNEGWHARTERRTQGETRALAHPPVLAVEVEAALHDLPPVAIGFLGEALLCCVDGVGVGVGVEGVTAVT